MRKGIILLTVLLLPITIYLIFAISTIHYVRVPHYGPASARMIIMNGREKKDSVYYSVDLEDFGSSPEVVDVSRLAGHMYIACFIQADSSHNYYNCAALKAYYKVNKGELDTLHFAIISPMQNDSSKQAVNYVDSLGLKKELSVNLYPDSAGLLELQHSTYFPANSKSKTQAWKSKRDLILVDTKGCIRGFYDGRYAPEITRMIEDIKHIKFHDEAVGMERKYTPVKKQ